MPAEKPEILFWSNFKTVSSNFNERVFFYNFMNCVRKSFFKSWKCGGIIHLCCYRWDWIQRGIGHFLTWITQNFSKFVILSTMRLFWEFMNPSFLWRFKRDMSQVEKCRRKHKKFYFYGVEFDGFYKKKDEKLLRKIIISSEKREELNKVSTNKNLLRASMQSRNYGQRFGSNSIRTRSLCVCEFF